jgi:hypothetical protein
MFVRDLLFVHASTGRWIGLFGSALFLIAGGWAYWRAIRIRKWLRAHPPVDREGD